jgi:hypothetical protein
MLDFSGGDEKAELVLLHYAKQFNDEFIIQLVERKADIQNRNEAICLAKFYWKILDSSAQDHENRVVVMGESDLQFWMERLLNIIGGYLSKIGYSHDWNVVCDEA